MNLSRGTMIPKELCYVLNIILTFVSFKVQLKKNKK